eukprot:CAMPEP_0170345486 /NCGR_PEP_ID=MMETSP0116_2-20130129/73974_1 /TAXON_ID=400756 /ORGANISM="Durinskia baltica, Strain CSIRO CS-38" /LENGTH=211 /DNA_ID=CAMNT_0010599251 /DNA_START=114 /DNA_END=748 /DNA_ORIENTATION=-
MALHGSAGPGGHGAGCTPAASTAGRAEAVACSRRRVRLEASVVAEACGGANRGVAQRCCAPAVDQRRLVLRHWLVLTVHAEPQEHKQSGCDDHNRQAHHCQPLRPPQGGDHAGAGAAARGDASALQQRLKRRSPARPAAAAPERALWSMASAAVWLFNAAHSAPAREPKAPRACLGLMAVALFGIPVWLAQQPALVVVLDGVVIVVAAMPC